MKKIIAVLSLIICITMLLCGCGGRFKIKEITFTSIQSDKKITLNVSGSTFNSGIEDMGKARYWSSKSKDETIEELTKKNRASITTVCGYDFITFAEEEGIYNLRVSEEEGETKIIIDDMSAWCEYDFTLHWADYYVAVFPYFLLASDDSNEAFWLEEGTPVLNVSYQCDADLMLEIVKQLGIWDIEEHSDGFSLYYGNQGIRIVKDEDSVMLQTASLYRQSVFTYDTTKSRTEILSSMEREGVELFSIGEEIFVATDRFFTYNNVYHVQITPIDGIAYHNRITLDCMFTKIVNSDGTALCEIPFPYMLLSNEGATCGSELQCGKEYACNAELLSFIKESKGWEVKEASGATQIYFDSARIQFVVNDGILILQPVSE